MSDQLLALISLIALALSAFYSGCETAFIAADRIRLRHFSSRGDRRAKMVLRYINRPGHFLSTVLVGTNVANIGCVATFTALTVRHFGDAGVSLATAILVPVILIFGEIIPKGVFLYYADRASITSAYPLKVISLVFYPAVKSFSAATDFLLNTLRMERRRKQVVMTREELLFHLADSEEAGLIEKETRALASRAVWLQKLRARDVMVPLESVVMVPEGLELNAYRSIFAREGYSRLPVYRGTRENVTGVLSFHNVMDVLARGSEDLHPNEPYFIPLDIPIVEVLFKMKDHGCHMAMIQDRSKQVVGMTTLEDIIARLVGRLQMNSTEGRATRDQ
jgi:CBS domain containing-hemolysin-like protein